MIRRHQLPVVLLAVVLAALYPRPGLTQDFTRDEDRGDRFAFEFPSHWVSEVKGTATGGTALVLSGANGGDESYDAVRGLHRAFPEQQPPAVP